MVTLMSVSDVGTAPLSVQDRFRWYVYRKELEEEALCFSASAVQAWLEETVHREACHRHGPKVRVSVGVVVLWAGAGERKRGGAVWWHAL